MKHDPQELKMLAHLDLDIEELEQRLELAPLYCPLSAGGCYCNGVNCGCNGANCIGNCGIDCGTNCPSVCFLDGCQAHCC